MDITNPNNNSSPPISQRDDVDNEVLMRDFKKKGIVSAHTDIEKSADMTAQIEGPYAHYYNFKSA